jgi:two-component system, NarL family, invasion response regulator UvrY
MANVVLVDDHSLLRNGLAELLKNLGHQVLFEANHGADFIKGINPNALPDIVLMDINMPEMNGFDASLWLKQHHPEVRVLALSMYDNENAIIRMLKCGARGYILKDSDPRELKKAIEDVLQKGYYYSDLVNGKIIHAINKIDDNGDGDLKQLIPLTDREEEFLKYTCTELTYREIAEKMFLSPRTIDGYRDNLFDKLKLKSRVGLAIYAIRHGLVRIDSINT